MDIFERSGEAANLPSLLPFLTEELLANIMKRLESKRKLDNNVEPVHREEARRILNNLTIDAFVQWCTDYLSEHHIGEVFAVDSNIGLVFDNLKRCVVCPLTDVAGTTLDAGAIAVTGRRNKD